MTVVTGARKTIGEPSPENGPRGGGHRARTPSRSIRFTVRFRRFKFVRVTTGRARHNRFSDVIRASGYVSANYRAGAFRLNYAENENEELSRS